MEKIRTGGPNAPVHEKVGETAGRVWRQLRAHGPANHTSLARSIGATETEILMALGWLAREGKVRDQSEGRFALVEREMSINP